jgi:hypothetical protein
VVSAKILKYFSLSVALATAMMDSLSLSVLACGHSRYSDVVGLWPLLEKWFSVPFSADHCVTAALAA